MAVQRTLLVIADISGYTRFMKVHRVNLAHAQDVIARLLESVIDGARPHLKLSKLEGDAALFYATLGAKEKEGVGAVTARIDAIRRAFLLCQRRLELSRACACDGCVQAGELRLKFVVHVGDVAFQKVKSFTELAGLDVILVHRMLKNSVPVGEYTLMTEGILAGLTDDERARAAPITESLEGAGDGPLHYVDLADRPLPLPELDRPSLARRLWELFKMNLRSVPYILGVKTACDGFRNFDAAPALPAKADDDPGERPFPA